MSTETMHQSLVSVENHYSRLYHAMFNTDHHTFESQAEQVMAWNIAKDQSYTLFKWEDWPAWVTFTVAFMVLITFDNMVLCRDHKAMTMTKAVVYSIFWIFTAMAFCSWVYAYYGPNQAFMWMSGYMLEWMLSFDNLFVFHMIFTIYGCPDNLKHRPLFLGICGAVFFRLIFIFVGEYLMHSLFFMHFIFGGFLVWTGLKTMTGDEEDEDPSQHPLVVLLTKHVPFVPAYDESGKFFVEVPVDENGEALDLVPSVRVTPPAGSPSETTAIINAEAGNAQERTYGTINFAAAARGATKTQTRATMLFLVVCCLEVSDILFAVDSVSAIVAQVPDLFLAYTSAVFAMLGLRATFFIIDVLVKLFSLLKYGVGAVLVFVGFKLICSKWYHVPPGIVCMFLFTALASSMVASVIKDDMEKKADAAAERKQAGLTRSPVPSPIPKMLGSKLAVPA